MTTGTRKFEVENRCEVLGKCVGFFKGIVPYTKLYWVVLDPYGQQHAYHRSAVAAEQHAAELNELFKHQL